MVGATISRLPLAPNDQYKPSNIKYQCCVNKLFVDSLEQSHDDGLPLYIIQQVGNGKGLVKQSELSVNLFKTYQDFKNSKIRD